MLIDTKRIQIITLALLIVGDSTTTGLPVVGSSSYLLGAAGTVRHNLPKNIRKNIPSSIIQMRGGASSSNNDTSSESIRPSSSPNPIFKMKEVTLNDNVNATPAIPNVSTNGIAPQKQNNDVVNFVFSDVDGTLVHYPDVDQMMGNDYGGGNDDDDNKIIYLPPSSTGMRGVISSKSLRLCQILRKTQNVKLVLISGMRTSTLIKRLPYLPKADAYCSEAGGRIFFSVDNFDGEGASASASASGIATATITPVPFDGATEEDLRPFGLQEDELWRSKLSLVAGSDGYVGDAMDLFLGKTKEISIIPLEERRGSLWDFANDLKQKGYTIDYKGYSNCFRVNLKQQRNISKEKFEELKSIDVSKHGLATSVNLGCIDFYPSSSGKKSCCEYLAHHYSEVTRSNAENEFTTDDFVLKRCICLCDDDNDLEMAMACGTVYLPSISSLSMKHAAKFFPDQIFNMENKEEGITETKATEKALTQALLEFQRRSMLKP